jgi:hypothetical protein
MISTLSTKNTAIVINTACQNFRFSSASSTYGRNSIEGAGSAGEPPATPPTLEGTEGAAAPRSGVDSIGGRESSGLFIGIRQLLDKVYQNQNKINIRISRQSLVVRWSGIQAIR